MLRRIRRGADFPAFRYHAEKIGVMGEARLGFSPARVVMTASGVKVRKRFPFNLPLTVGGDSDGGKIMGRF